MTVTNPAAFDEGELIVEPKRPTGRGAKPRAAEPDDDDDLPDLSDVPTPTPAAPALAPRLTIAGVPDVEADPDLIESRRKHKAIEDAIAAADAKVQAFATTFGIASSLTRGKLEAIVIDLLADGRPAADVAAMQHEANHARLLREAARKTSAAVHAALEAATLRASRLAAELIHVPAQQALADAALVFLAAVHKYDEAVGRLHAARLTHCIHRVLPEAVYTDARNNYFAAEMLRNGLVTREQMRDALPNLIGL